MKLWLVVGEESGRAGHVVRWILYLFQVRVPPGREVEMVEFECRSDELVGQRGDWRRRFVRPGMCKVRIPSLVGWPFVSSAVMVGQVTPCCRRPRWPKHCSDAWRSFRKRRYETPSPFTPH